MLFQIFFCDCLAQFVKVKDRHEGAGHSYILGAFQVPKPGKRLLCKLCRCCPLSGTKSMQKQCITLEKEAISLSILLASAPHSSEEEECQLLFVPV